MERSAHSGSAYGISPGSFLSIPQIEAQTLGHRINLAHFCWRIVQVFNAMHTHCKKSSFQMIHSPSLP